MVTNQLLKSVNGETTSFVNTTTIFRRKYGNAETTSLRDFWKLFQLGKQMKLRNGYALLMIHDTSQYLRHATVDRKNDLSSEDDDVLWEHLASDLS